LLQVDSQTIETVEIAGLGQHVSEPHRAGHRRIAFCGRF